jgi:hypothetical protein
MRVFTNPWAITCIAVASFGGVGLAIAQEAPATAAGGAGAAPATELRGGEDVSLTPPQMLDRARGYIPEMEKHRAAVAEQLADAKKRKDVVKALCLDDKVKQMKLATDTAKDRVVALTSAVSQTDADRSKHEFTVIQVLRERVLTLVTEAQQCIGEETGFVGNTDVTVDIDPSIADSDSDLPEDQLVSEVPVLSSPTL